MTLGELAGNLGLALSGEPEHQIRGLAPIESARAFQLSLAVDVSRRAALRASGAGAVILPPELEGDARAAGVACLVSTNPYASFARASWLLTPESRPDPGIASDACVADDARIDETASVGAGVTIARGVTVGANVIVGDGCVIGEGVEIGADSRLFPRVVLYPGVTLGTSCRVQSGAVIGAEGFGFAPEGIRWLPIRQSGGVRVGDRVHIGANTTIDCGTLEPTVIESDVILDNQIQIAHNVQIGENTAIAGCTGIAGSTRIGRRCRIGGACNIVGHIEIADEVTLNAASLVTRSITASGRYGSGMPLLRSQSWKRSFVILSRLDDLLRRLQRLERDRAPDEA